MANVLIPRAMAPIVIDLASGPFGIYSVTPTGRVIGRMLDSIGNPVGRTLILDVFDVHAAQVSAQKAFC